jgi:hypothetical protein
VIKLIFEIEKATYGAITEIEEPLKLIETKDSEDYNIYKIEINTLEELMLLRKQVDQRLIISENCIMIYDDLIE